MKKLLLLPIFAIACLFTRIDSAWAIDYPFSVTTSAISDFSFEISAQGTFFVDCGTGGTLSGTGAYGGDVINKTNTSRYTYTCSYSDSAIRTIRFGGTATNYHGSYPAIRFALSNYKITSVSGNLSTIFPYISGNASSGPQPRFVSTFNEVTSLQSIPDTLFSGYTTGASNMFSGTFFGCTGLTSIPADLFKNITTGATNTFNQTFYGCSNLTGYISPTLFDGLIKNNAATNTFDQTFSKTGLAESCPSGTEYATNYTSGWGGKVSCTGSPSYSVVTYSCGSDSTLPSYATAMSGASFTPATDACSVPDGYNGFSGWLVSGTSDVKPAGTAFTWNYLGNKTLTAQYTGGNTINMTFDGETTTPATCTFGSTFVPPTPAARPGYVFTGWKIKPKTCGIPSLDTSIDGTKMGYQCDSTSTYGQNLEKTSDYGITTDNRWAVEFPYGTVWGKANCNNTSGTDYTAGTPTLASSGSFCWCQATGFTASGNSYTSGPQCTTTASSSWVFYTDYFYNESLCMSHCADGCARGVQGTASFRAAVFGAVVQ